jgi:ribosome-associated protein
MTEKIAVKKSKAVPRKLTSRKKALLAVEAGQANKAADPVVIKVGDLVDYTDYFAVMHGESTVQVQAIVEGILALVSQSKSPVYGVEGEMDGRWVVIDWGDVVIHVFLKELRDFYELEKLWADAPRVKVPE